MGLDDFVSFPAMIGSDHCIVVAFVLHNKKIFKLMYHMCFEQYVFRETILCLSVLFPLFIKKSIYHSTFSLSLQKQSVLIG